MIQRDPVVTHSQILQAMVETKIMKRVIQIRTETVTTKIVTVQEKASVQTKADINIMLNIIMTLITGQKITSMVMRIIMITMTTATITIMVTTATTNTKTSVQTVVREDDRLVLQTTMNGNENVNMNKMSCTRRK